MKSLRKQLDELWAECVKFRAGYKSEISGTPGRQIGGEAILHAHHLAHKPGNVLRWHLANGICITAGEHKFGAHGPHEEEFRKKVQALRGENIFEVLDMLKYDTMKDKTLCKIYLESEIKRLKGEKSQN